MKRINSLVILVFILLALVGGIVVKSWAQGPFFPGRGKPTGPPTVSSLTADEQTSLTNAQNALTTAAQNLAAVKQAILTAHGDKPCLPTDATCTRATLRPDGFIETVTYTQTPRAVTGSTVIANPASKPATVSH